MPGAEEGAVAVKEPRTLAAAAVAVAVRPAVRISGTSSSMASAKANTAPGTAVIDLFDDVPAHDPRSAAYLLAAYGPEMPAGAVIVAVVDPGVYSLRLAVVDEQGRRGAIVREVNAWKMAGEEFAVADLVVGTPPSQGQTLLDEGFDVEDGGPDQEKPAIPAN